MNHPTEEQFVLYYYGDHANESREIEEHIGVCEHCRGSYQALQRVLNSVDSFPVPERAPEYENRVWASIETRLEKRSRLSRWLREVKPKVKRPYEYWVQEFRALPAALRGFAK